MQIIQREGYTKEEILSALHAESSSRNVRFRYNLLDKNEKFLKELTSVTAGEVSMSAFSTLKRTAKFEIKEGDGKPIKRLKNIIPTWENAVNVTVNENGDLTKTGGANSSFDADIVSNDRIVEGFVEFTVEGAISQYIMVGLNADNSSRSFEDLDFALYLTDIGQGYKIYESGVSRFTSPTLLTAGDKVRVEILEDKTVVYKVNGEVIYTSLVKATDSRGYFADTSFYFLSKSIKSVTLGRYTIEEGIDYLTDRIQPLMQVKMPSKLTEKEKTTAFRVDFNKVTPPTGVAGATVVSVKDNYSTFLTTNIDPMINIYNQTGGDPERFRYVEMRYRIRNGKSSNWEVFFTNDLASGAIAQHTISAGSLIADGNWHTAQVDGHIHPLWKTGGKIDGYRLDFATVTGVEIDIAYTRLVEEKNIVMEQVSKWVTFPLGIFLLSTPTRVERNNEVFREVEAYDGLLILDEDKFTERYFIVGEQKYTDAVKQLLASAGITKFNIEDSLLEMDEFGIEFKIGDSKLSAINKLLSALNFTPIWVDSNGYFTSSKYVSPAVKAVDYAYVDDELSVMYNGLEEELDLFGISNSWVVVQSNPEKTPLISTMVNDDPRSPISTVSIGRNIVDYREIDEIADQATLDAYVARVAFESTQVFGKVKFGTALMPFHEYSDVIRVRYTPLGLDDVFAETSWTMPLEIGGKMVHEARRVVSL